MISKNSHISTEVELRSQTTKTWAIRCALILSNSVQRRPMNVACERIKSSSIQRRRMNVACETIKSSSIQRRLHHIWELARKQWSRAARTDDRNNMNTICVDSVELCTETTSRHSVHHLQTPYILTGLWRWISSPLGIFKDFGDDDQQSMFD